MKPCRMIKDKMNSLRKSLIAGLIVSFISSSLVLPSAQAQAVTMPFMPKPGVMVSLSPQFTPAHLQGLTVHPDNALQFDFLIHRGDQPFNEIDKKDEYNKLIKYFLASLTVPDENQWVNLSPYEKDRIIKDDFGQTEMGRDLLTQDYILKQITSSLIYPEGELGKKFWNKVYERAYKEFGTTNVPVNTFNKVWIVPDEAAVYESGNTVYVLRNHLKVMLEEDYLSLEKHSAVGVIASSEAPLGFGTKQSKASDNNKAHALASQIVKEIILPELEKEVNEGKNFAQLRQIYSGMILATWYKHVLKESLLGKVYADKAKVKGVDQDPKTNEAIYQQYLKAFKKGVFNFIKEDADRYTQELIPRKYFSGGMRTVYWPQVSRFNPQTIPSSMAQTVASQIPKLDSAMTNLQPGNNILPSDQFDQGKAFEVTLYPVLKGKKALNAFMDDQKFKGPLRFSVSATDVRGRPQKLIVPKLGMYFSLLTELLKQGKLGYVKESRNFVIPSADPGPGLRDLAAYQSYKGTKALSVEPLKLRVNGKISALDDGSEAFMTALLRANLLMFNAGGVLAIRPTTNAAMTTWRDLLSSVTFSPDERLKIVFMPKKQPGLQGFADGVFIFKSIDPGAGTITAIRTSLVSEEMVLHFDSNEQGPMILGIQRFGRSQKTMLAPTVEGLSVGQVIGFIAVREETGFSPVHAQGKIGAIDLAHGTIQVDLDGPVKETRTYSLRPGTQLPQILAVNVFSQPSAAMVKTGRPSDSNTDLGGIDMNAANMNLLIKRDGAGVPLPLDQQNLEQLRQIPGFIPVIIEIKPVINLPILSELQDKLQSVPVSAGAT